MKEKIHNSNLRLLIIILVFLILIIGILTIISEKNNSDYVENNFTQEQQTNSIPIDNKISLWLHQLNN